MPLALAFSMSRRRDMPVGSLSSQSMARWHHGEHCHSATGSASGPAAQARPISSFFIACQMLSESAMIRGVGPGTRGGSAHSEPDRDPA